LKKEGLQKFSSVKFQKRSSFRDDDDYKTVIIETPKKRPSEKLSLNRVPSIDDQDNEEDDELLLLKKEIRNKTSIT